MDILQFKKVPFLGIMRGVQESQLESLVEASIAGGLKALEITMNTSEAASLIRSAAAITKGRLVIGAGTVCDVESLRQALDVGATFIVSPVLVEEVVSHCRKQSIPVFPGALTPQEIYRAWDAGATMVKVFPAKFFGPAYFKEIKGPFHDIKLLACGGVTPENKNEFFSNGADAVAFGESVFRKEWISGKEYHRITDRIKNYINNTAFDIRDF